MAEPIVIVGAGIGGLSAAIRLAAAGRRVIVLEKNAQVGGKMGEFSAAGFRWDTGPSVITMRTVLTDLFQAAGRRMEDYLTLLPVEPLTRYFYRDGVILDATPDLAAMNEQIAAIAPRDVEGYLAFLAYAARLHRLTGPTFIYNEPPNAARLLQLPLLDLLKIDPWFTMQQVIDRHVQSPYLRQLLGRFATYVGASPFQAPATLSVIAHVELTSGVWYPQGGVYAIARVLTKLAAELDVQVRTEAAVARITIEHGRASGVQLATGELLKAAAVIANVDVTTVYQYMLPPQIATPARRQQAAVAATACSGYVLLLGIVREHAQLAHHNIFFSADYRREFEDIFVRGVPPVDPTVYVAITSKRDAAHAPPGRENWFVLVNAPPLGANFDWATQEPQYRQRVFDTLAHFGLNVAKEVDYMKVFTPIDLARGTGAWRGALYGASSNHMLSAFRRPPNRSTHVKGLYFAGGTTHPGGGVPMVMLSGKVAAEMIKRDFGF